MEAEVITIESDAIEVPRSLELDPPSLDVATIGCAACRGCCACCPLAHNFEVKIAEAVGEAETEKAVAEIDEYTEKFNFSENTQQPISFKQELSDDNINFVTVFDKKEDDLTQKIVVEQKDVLETSTIRPQEPRDNEKHTFPVAKQQTEKEDLIVVKNTTTDKPISNDVDSPPPVVDLDSLPATPQEEVPLNEPQNLTKVVVAEPPNIEFSQLAIEPKFIALQKSKTPKPMPEVSTQLFSSRVTETASIKDLNFITETKIEPAEITFSLLPEEINQSNEILVESTIEESPDYQSIEEVELVDTQENEVDIYPVELQPQPKKVNERQSYWRAMGIISDDDFNDEIDARNKKTKQKVIRIANNSKAKNNQSKVVVVVKRRLAQLAFQKMSYFTIAFY